MTIRTFIFLVFMVAGGLIGLCFYEHTQQSHPIPEIRILIRPKTSLLQISHHLQEKRLIPSSWRWCLMARLGRKSQHLKAGEYLFKGDLTPAQILDKIVRGETLLHFITFPEGMTVSEMRDRLEAAPFLEGELSSDLPSEGSFFPNTYAYQYGDKREEIILRLQKTMAQTLKALWETRDPHLPYQMPEELLILASIVEKETALDEERPRIARVFINRLNRRMPLQADPTLLYGLNLLCKKEERKQDLSKKELKEDFPYNTYTRRGLPPTPIACPGLSSLKAAAHPAEGSDLYFVADGTGAHQFATTLQHHQKNHSQWRAFQKKSLS